MSDHTPNCEHLEGWPNSYPVPTQRRDLRPIFTSEPWPAAPEISVMVHHDEARHLEASERCPVCQHLNVLHDRQGCQLCKCEQTR